MPLRSVTPPFSLQVHGLFYGWPGVCVVVEESHQPGQAAGQGKQLQGISTFFFFAVFNEEAPPCSERRADQEKVGLPPPSYPWSFALCTQLKLTLTNVISDWDPQNTSSVMNQDSLCQQVALYSTGPRALWTSSTPTFLLALMHSSPLTLRTFNCLCKKKSEKRKKQNLSSFFTLQAFKVQTVAQRKCTTISFFAVNAVTCCRGVTAPRDFVAVTSVEIRLQTEG